MVGFDKEGNIIDYSLLSHAETPGLGSKAADWFKKGGKGDITGMNPGAKALTVSKDGGQIDAITASTITSRAFLKVLPLVMLNARETEPVNRLVIPLHVKRLAVINVILPSVTR